VAFGLKPCPFAIFMIPIKLSQKPTPFSCKEHIPSSKMKKWQDLKIPKENLSAFIKTKLANELYSTTQTKRL
jgi:hypothetical protein